MEFRLAADALGRVAVCMAYGSQEQLVVVPLPLASFAVVYRLAAAVAVLVLVLAVSVNALRGGRIVDRLAFFDPFLETYL